MQIDTTKNLMPLHNYDITEYAMNAYKKECYSNPPFQGYVICSDTWDFHVYRIQIGLNAQYDEDEDTSIIEQDKISNRNVAEWLEEKFETEIPYMDERSLPPYLVREFGLDEVLKAVFEKDVDNGFENWDVYEHYTTDIDDMKHIIEDIWGITEIKIDENDNKESEDK